MFIVMILLGLDSQLTFQGPEWCKEKQCFLHFLVVVKKENKKKNKTKQNMRDIKI